MSRRCAEHFLFTGAITVLGLSLGSDTSAKSDTVHDTVSLAKRDIFFPSSVQGKKTRQTTCSKEKADAVTTKI